MGARLRQVEVQPNILELDKCHHAGLLEQQRVAVPVYSKLSRWRWYNQGLIRWE